MFSIALIWYLAGFLGSVLIMEHTFIKDFESKQSSGGLESLLVVTLSVMAGPITLILGIVLFLKDVLYFWLHRGAH